MQKSSHTRDCLVFVQIDVISITQHHGGASPDKRPAFIVLASSAGFRLDLPITVIDSHREKTNNFLGDRRCPFRDVHETAAKSHRV